MVDKRSSEPGQYPRLAFVVDGPLIAQFFLLLQQGVRIQRRVGCSVDAFLRKELKAGPATIEKIQSIMLDGKPVDDIGSALVHDGSVLALSAAMPGLVGATLRRGGTYSSFRSGITYQETAKTCAPGEGWVLIKLFNLLMAELGPGLLQQGVLVNIADLADFLAERVSDLGLGCRSITLDNKTVDAGRLRDEAGLAGKDWIFLSVSSGKSEA